MTTQRYVIHIGNHSSRETDDLAEAHFIYDHERQLSENNWHGTSEERMTSRGQQLGATPPLRIELYDARDMKTLAVYPKPPRADA